MILLENLICGPISTFSVIKITSEGRNNHKVVTKIVFFPCQFSIKPGGTPNVIAEIRQ